MKLSTALWVVVDALACYRLTVLVTKDMITEPLRMALGKRSNRAYDFITCPWCTSVWLAAGVVVASKFIPQVWVYPALFLAYSAVAGALAELVP